MTTFNFFNFGLGTLAIVAGVVALETQIRPPAGGAPGAPEGANGSPPAGPRVTARAIIVGALHVDIAALAAGMVIWDERVMAVTAALAAALVGAALALGAGAKESDDLALGWAIAGLILLFLAFLVVPGWRAYPC
ncbi:MAG: hypothetical protein JNM60_11305 [Candidatus Competibacteraceae bacterium]|nr:hypothetical protein [Candidatus Competibacteraceae bacterium]